MTLIPRTVVLLAFCITSCLAASKPSTLNTLLNNITKLISGFKQQQPHSALLVNNKASTLIVDNDNKDALTALLYHIEHTKRCGENLQKLNNKIARELVPLWSSKFKPELKKALALTNTLNHLIAAIQTELTNDTNVNSQITNDHLANTFYSRIVNSNVLTSLGHFLFSNWNDNDPEPEPDEFLASVQSYSYKLPRFAANIAQEHQQQSNNQARSTTSQFVIGYGVYLKHSNHCAFVYRKKSDGTLVKTSSCAHMNLFSSSSNNNRQQQKPTFVEEHDESPYFSAQQFDDLDEDDGDYPDDSNGEEDATSGAMSFTNCRNWFLNLQKTFKSASISLTNDDNDDDDTQQSRLNRYKNYKLLLNRFISLQNMSSSQWCGPYYECQNTTATFDWLLIYALPLFESRTHELLGAVLVKLNLTLLDINQCHSGDPVFANTHKCRPNLECVYAPRKAPFRAGGYWCKCINNLVGFDGVGTLYDGKEIELQYWYSRSGKSNNYTTGFNCMECSGPNCCLISSYLNSVKERNPSFASSPTTAVVDDYTSIKNNMLQCRNYDWSLRYFVLVVQLFVIGVILSFAVLTFLLRQNKIVKQSMWKLLELILLGALLLNITLIIQFFEPSSSTCLAVPWFRELGFSIVYGILNLRLYKLLIEFQSRKAHCVHFKEKDILRSLSIIVGCVLGYLVGWTLVDMDFATNEGFSLLTQTNVKTYIIQFPICKVKWWDYFIEIIEFLFISVGCYLIYCTRTAPSEYNERKFIKLVVYCEAIISTLLHIIKHSIYTSLHPDYMLLLYFIRCHATVSIMLILVFVTKMCYIIKTGDYQLSVVGTTSHGGDHGHHDVDALGELGTKLPIGNGEATGGELSIVDMEPEEIRSELKRLYTQLYIFKSKSVKVDNPHLQKDKKKKDAKNKTRRLSNTILNFATKQQQQPQETLLAEKKNSSSTSSKTNNATSPSSVLNATTPLSRGGGGGGGGDNESLQVRTPDESVCSTEGPGGHSSGCGTESDHGGVYVTTAAAAAALPRKSNLHMHDTMDTTTTAGGGGARSVQFK